MEAKLKALRVADLRELLQKASVPIPAKANKADLIAKILASPAAVESLNNQGSAATSAAAVAKPKAPESSQGGGDDDLLAPPEEFDWGPTSASNGAAPASSAAPAQSAPKADSKPAASKPAVSAPGTSVQSATIIKPDAPSAATSEAAQDEELERRKKRAARFGIPLVEAKPKATPASNGAKAPRSAPKAQNLTPEEISKVEARAARFGIPKAATTIASATTGQKRARSPAPVDTDEMEKRKKRAERFAAGGEAKAQS